MIRRGLRHPGPDDPRRRRGGDPPDHHRRRGGRHAARTPGRSPGPSPTARWSRPRSTAPTRTGAGSSRPPATRASPSRRPTSRSGSTAIPLYRDGVPLPFDDAAASANLRANRETHIRLVLNHGDGRRPVLDLRPHRRVRPAQRRLHDLSGGLGRSGNRTHSASELLHRRRGRVDPDPPAVRSRDSAGSRNEASADARPAVGGRPSHGAEAMPPIPAQSSAAPTALIYITLGALLTVWSGIWFLYESNNGDPSRGRQLHLHRAACSRASPCSSIGFGIGADRPQGPGGRADRPGQAAKAARRRARTRRSPTRSESRSGSGRPIEPTGSGAIARARDSARSGFRLPGGGGQGAEDGEHRVEVGQAGAEAVDEVGQGEVAVDQVLVVLGDVVDQLAHQGGVDLFELAERLAALVEHPVVARPASAPARRSGGPAARGRPGRPRGPAPVAAAGSGGSAAGLPGSATASATSTCSRATGSPLGLPGVGVGGCPVGDTSIRYVHDDDGEFSRVDTPTSFTIPVTPSPEGGMVQYTRQAGPRDRTGRMNEVGLAACAARIAEPSPTAQGARWWKASASELTMSPAIRPTSPFWSRAMSPARPWA